METKTYLVNTDWNMFKKDIVQINNNPLTIQFKVMDKYTVIEIIGKKNGHTYEEFKHQIICNKEQDITILPAINDQVNEVDNLDAVNKQRVFIDRESDYINPEDLPLKSEHYILGLHGQLDLFNGVKSWNTF